MLKFFIALGAMVSLTVILALILYAPHEFLEIKVTLASAVIAGIIMVVSYVWAKETVKESEKS